MPHIYKPVKKPICGRMKKPIFVVKETLNFMLDKVWKSRSLKNPGLKQKPWIKSNSNTNTALRPKTDRENGKTISKSMNTSRYGKQIEDAKKRREPVTDYEKCVKKQSNSRFCGKKKHDTDGDNNFFPFFTTIKNYLLN